MVKEDHLGSYLNQETESQYINQALDNCAIYRVIRCGSCFLPNNSPVIACLTTVTELAITIEKAKPKPSLPPKYASYILVFLKEATDHVPPSHPYNHKINLNEAFKPKIGKAYSLSPKEQKAIKDFLDKNLRTGKIHPSNSPQAFPFFFVKMVMSVPVRTTAMSMNTQSVMHTPSHLSPTLLINSKEQRFSPNLMSAGDIITSISRTDTNGRLPLSPIKDSLDQL